MRVGVRRARAERRRVESGDLVSWSHHPRFAASPWPSQTLNRSCAARRTRDVLPRARPRCARPVSFAPALENASTRRAHADTRRPRVHVSWCRGEHPRLPSPHTHWADRPRESAGGQTVSAPGQTAYAPIAALAIVPSRLRGCSCQSRCPRCLPRSATPDTTPRARSSPSRIGTDVSTSPKTLSENALRKSSCLSSRQECRLPYRPASRGPRRPRLRWFW